MERSDTSPAPIMNMVLNKVAYAVIAYLTLLRTDSEKFRFLLVVTKSEEDLSHNFGYGRAPGFDVQSK